MSGSNNPFFGRHHSEKTKKALSKRFSGENNPQYGRRGKDALRYGKEPWIKGRTKETEPIIKEYSKKIGGENHYLYGKHLKPETKQKISERKKGKRNPCYGRTGEKHPQFGKRGKDAAHYGYILSPESRRKWSEERRGSNNANWRGGSAPFYGYNWKIQKEKALQRARYHCELTTQNGGELVVHHIISVRKFHEQFLRIVYPSLYKIASENGNFFAIFEKGIPIDSVFPESFYDVMNSLDNLFVIQRKWHICYELMPSAFFEALRHL